MQLTGLKEVMISRLIQKGITRNNIPAYLRNLQTAISDDPFITLKNLNRKMRFLGWKEAEMDDHTLQMILFVCSPVTAGKSSRKLVQGLLQPTSE